GGTAVKLGPERVERNLKAIGRTVVVIVEGDQILPARAQLDGAVAVGVAVIAPVAIEVDKWLTFVPHSIWRSSRTTTKIPIRFPRFDRLVDHAVAVVIAAVAEGAIEVHLVAGEYLGREELRRNTVELTHRQGVVEV